MEYTIRYHFIESEDLLISSLNETNEYVLFLKDNLWQLFDMDFIELCNKYNVKEISDFDAFIIMFGNFPHQTYAKLGVKIKEEEIKQNSDPFKSFLLDFMDFAKDDYYKHFHNKRKNLKYSAKELDTHYENAGYYEMIDDYYLEFLKRCKEFEFIKIIKKKNDYVIKFKKSIFNNKNE